MVGGMERGTGRDRIVERVTFLTGKVERFIGVGRGTAVGDLFEETWKDSWHQCQRQQSLGIAGVRRPSHQDVDDYFKCQGCMAQVCKDRLQLQCSASDPRCHWMRTARKGLSFHRSSATATPHRSPFITKAYARYVTEYPDLCKIVAIAEPRPKSQQIFAKNHNVDKTLVFTTWQDLHAASAETINTVGKRLADAVVIAVQDHMHLEVAAAFAEQGYHILCEKPMATKLEDCIKMETIIKKAGTIFGMGHGKYLSVHANWG